MSNELVLVTGGSGFVGAHCLVQLLGAGYRVRTTVRSLSREPEVRAMLAAGGAPADAPLAFVAADLQADAGWPEAVAGCDYVLHVASPFPARQPKNEDELIVPARDGALRVLRAARAAGVKRVVLTSSFAAIGYGHPPSEQPFTEETWSDLNGRVTPYVKSKTLAERAAWDFMTRVGGAMTLSVINPVGIFGPALGPDIATSLALLCQMLNGALPRLPRIYYSVVDVRDVADLHLRAMTQPAAAGQRFLATAGFMSVQDMARVLKARLGPAGQRVPTALLPDWLVRLVARVSPAAAEAAPNLGQIRKSSGEKARRVLGWAPRSQEEAIATDGESLVRLGLVKP